MLLPEILLDERDYVVCVKPCGVNSQDCPGGMPELLREACGEAEDILPVHRLDREVGGVMIYAKNAVAAAALSRQLNDRSLDKRYLAVACCAARALSAPGECGVLKDLLYHDNRRNKTYVVKRQRAGVRAAELEYRCLAVSGAYTLYDIHLITGRTHQIRVQLASRQAPLLGDAKYGGPKAPSMGLWAYRLSFCDIKSGERMTLRRMPPNEHPAFEVFREQIQSYKEDHIL